MELLAASQESKKKNESKVERTSTLKLCSNKLNISLVKLEANLETTAQNFWQALNYTKDNHRLPKVYHNFSLSDSAIAKQN